MSIASHKENRQRENEYDNSVEHQYYSIKHPLSNQGLSHQSLKLKKTLKHIENKTKEIRQKHPNIGGRRKREELKASKSKTNRLKLDEQ